MLSSSVLDTFLVGVVVVFEGVVKLLRRSCVSADVALESLEESKDEEDLEDESEEEEGVELMWRVQGEV